MVFKAVMYVTALKYGCSYVRAERQSWPRASGRQGASRAVLDEAQLRRCACRARAARLSRPDGLGCYNAINVHRARYVRAMYFCR